MKYTLLKKWHSSQVEEVGHVFEEDEDFDIGYGIENDDHWYVIYPHEIALLVHAGYLKEEDPTELIKKDIYKLLDKLINKNNKQVIEDWVIPYLLVHHKTKQSAEEALKRLLSLDEETK